MSHSSLENPDMIRVNYKRERNAATPLANARSKLPKKRRRVLPVEQPRRKKVENATNRRMNAIKHHSPVVFKDAFGGAKIGNVNGVNVIGLALQTPSVPSIAVLHHNGPYNLQSKGAEGELVSSAAPLQPRPATTGSVDVLPLQPKYLPTFEREFRSEPRDISPNRALQEIPTLRYDSSSPKQRHEYSSSSVMETELGIATAPALAIGSSTEILVSILENQAGFRRNSFLSITSKTSINEPKSPDCELVKSPSTEITDSSVHSNPVEEHQFDSGKKSKQTVSSEHCDT